MIGSVPLDALLTEDTEATVAPLPPFAVLVSSAPLAAHGPSEGLPSLDPLSKVSI